MKRFALLLLVGIACSSAAQKFVTERFDVDVAIKPDRSVEITESIAVRYTERQHGLLRPMPFRMRGEKNARRVEYSPIGAWIDGAATPLSASSQGDEFTLRIGDPNRWLNDRHTIKVAYRIVGALTDFEAKDLKSGDELGPRTEFYWNLLPLHWKTVIPKSRIRVDFPQPTSKLYAARILFGPRGERTGVNINSEGKIVGRTDLVAARFVSPTRLEYEIMKPRLLDWTTTVVLSLPEGTVSKGPTMTEPLKPAASTQEVQRFIDSIPSKPWGMALPAIPALLLALLKRRAINKPMMVRFEPPEGVTAPDAGVINDGRFDPRDFLAALVTIAQKGHWKLAREDDQTVIRFEQTRVCRPLDDFEEVVWNQMQPFAPLAGADTIKESFGPGFRILDSAIWARHRARQWANEGSVAKSCSGCMIIGISVPLAFVLLPFVGFWSFLGIPIAIVAGWIGLSKWTTLREPGEQVRWELQGLREFISRAKTDELNWASKRQPDQALFEDLLPFAIAFGLVTEWAKAFEGIQFSQPDWFVGDSTIGFYDYYWMSMMMNDFSSEWGDATSSAISPISEGGGWSDGDSGSGSSGFSGSDWNSGGGFDGGGSFDSGGSAGDGGGGGGGDSW